MEINKIIKDQCERNREKHQNYLHKRFGATDYVLSEKDLDQITQQTAEAVLSAVVEMLRVNHTFREKEEGESGKKYFAKQAQHQNTIENLLTQLTNKDV